jgi:uridine kinase
MASRDSGRGGGGAASEPAANPCELVIAVAGGSGSGKSLFAGALADRMAPRPVVLISEDDYYRRVDEPDFDPRRFDFDAPSARDHELLARHLAELRQGRAIRRPVYSFRRHAPLKRRARTAPAPVVIVEGLHVLHDAEVRQQIDFAIYLDVDDDIRFIRRLLRDTRERGRSIRGVTDQYLATVKPAHERYVAPARAAADLVLDLKSHAGFDEAAVLQRWLDEAVDALARR